MLVSNRGGALRGGPARGRAAAAGARGARPEGAARKQDALDLGRSARRGLHSIFTTFGSFSIAAGILLIFLIFVMLAAERRGELGIARAVVHAAATSCSCSCSRASPTTARRRGRRARRHRRGLRHGARDRQRVRGHHEVHDRVRRRGRSVVVAYALGVLLTLAVVAFSAWRVSRMNIVTAIRNTPDPAARARAARPGRRRRRARAGLLRLAGGGVQ